jgi:hypothetical protein
LILGIELNYRSTPTLLIEIRLQKRLIPLAPVALWIEFVEVSAQILPADAIVGGERPPLEVREGAVDPGQQHVRRHRADNLGLVLVFPAAPVGGQTVADYGGPSATTRSTKPVTLTAETSRSGSNRMRRGMTLQRLTM